MTSEFDYDLFVVGGGSGGLAASKAAAARGAKVAVADFVKPSPQGTTWGLGGTCVNVGCIPKKLFHLAALAGEAGCDAAGMGWETEGQHTWDSMVEKVGGYIKSLNWGYKTELRSKQVKYYNAFATFVDRNTVELEDKKGKKETVTAKFILIACGGRPDMGDYPGAEECCISSDDIFWRRTPPGKTLVVGASYIALECAGFINALGFDTTVMVRSILLRGFDQSMATVIGSYMEHHGCHFAREMVPTRFEKEEGKQGVKVWAKPTGTSDDNEKFFGTFDTVVMAIGRKACGSWLGLEQAGVKYNTKNGKIFCDEEERTSVSNVFAIGDVIEGGLELTPVAIQAGRLLADRLFGNSEKLMDYSNVATAVFTPLEYGTVGLSEEDALRQLGDNCRIYHSYFKPLAWNLNHERRDNDCYAKMIVNSADNERVVGLHVVGPNAGEIVQGFAVAMKCGATKSVFDETVGIHPTDAEVFTTLVQVKQHGVTLEAAGGC